ncbi:MAG TPA: hypothetical protein VD905_11490, partial [Flavobacteriales bacterium]|nr:hypothetical protein [Flavobacteriales bacterium]
SKMITNYFDLLLSPIYLIIIYFLASAHQEKHIHKNPAYKYYTKGLFVKLLGAIGVCIIYQFYYSGGDTINYFTTSEAISNMLFKDPIVFIDIMMGDNSWEAYSNFDPDTGFPLYWLDKHAFFVSRLITPIILLSCKTFVPAALLLAWFCYSGLWRLFLLFNYHFPQIQRQLAIAILFIPSVVFWGSGLLKDTITLSAVGWYTYHFYLFFIQKRYKVSGAICIFISAFLLIAIKPYILFALLPGSLIWLSNERIARIRNRFMRVVAAPMLITFGIGASFLALSQMGDFLGHYAIDNVLERAVVVNLDQKQEYYGGNSFDIGEFDATIGSMLGKAHLAIAYALFGPFLWEVRNPVMLLSAIENTYIMLLTVFLLFRLKFFGFFTLIGKNPLLLFSVLFSLFFAFSVGIATSNFGSLVRLKIPCIPFYVSSLFVLKHFYDERRNRIKMRYVKKQKQTAVI